MTWLIVFTVVNIALTTGIVLLLHRRRDLRPGRDAALEQQELASMREVGRLFNEMMQQVDRQVEEHSDRIKQINHEMEASGDAPAVVEAVAKVLSINDKLALELQSARHELQRQRQELEALGTQARTDGLTGLANRRSLDEHLAGQLEAARVERKPVSLLLLDVDRFKKLNDEYGHQAGDKVLQQMAQVLRSGVCKSDLPARYGGEEFAVVMPGTRLAAAERVAERLRTAIEGIEVPHEALVLKITASIGVTDAIAGDNVGVMLRRADEALYAAKNNGRNRTYRNTGAAIEPVGATPVEPPKSPQVVLAPYRDGELPDGADFAEFACHDMTAGGFSFMAPQLPTCTMFVVDKEEASGRHFVLARVAHTRNDGTEAQPRYYVECIFQGRLADRQELAIRKAHDAARVSRAPAEKPPAESAAATPAAVRP